MSSEDSIENDDFTLTIGGISDEMCEAGKTTIKIIHIRNASVAMSPGGPIEYDDFIPVIDGKKDE